MHNQRIIRNSKIVTESFSLLLFLSTRAKPDMKQHYAIFKNGNGEHLDHRKKSGN